MISDFHKPDDLEGVRWRTTRLGLRLANNWIGLRVFLLFFGLWCLIGLALCLVLIPFAVAGKVEVFSKALEPVAMYGYALPIAFIVAATWGVKLFSRLLWCWIPEPFVARFLALVSTVGRLAVLFALGYIWYRGKRFRNGLLLPAVLACSGAAWLGLAAEWVFIWVVHGHFIPNDETANSSGTPDNEADIPNEEELGEEEKNVLTRNIDPGRWLKKRFPRGHALVTWVVFPLGYAALTSITNDGDPKAIPKALLMFSVIYPAILQAFVGADAKIEGLLEILSPAPAQAAGRK